MHCIKTKSVLIWVDEFDLCFYIHESLGDHTMTTFIGVIHIIIALVLIILVLIQDSKSNGALGMGGGASGSNSLLGATGAQSLAGKMTVWAAIIFAVTCLTLSVMTSTSSTKSVVDSMAIPSAPPVENQAPAATPTESTPAEAPAATDAAPAGN